MKTITLIPYCSIKVLIFNMRHGRKIQTHAENRSKKIVKIKTFKFKAKL